MQEWEKKYLDWQDARQKADKMQIEANSHQRAADEARVASHGRYNDYTKAFADYTHNLDEKKARGY